MHMPVEAMSMYLGVVYMEVAFHKYTVVDTQEEGLNFEEDMS